MSNGSFNGVLSPWSHDHSLTYAARMHRDEKAKNDRIDRALSLVREKLAGQTFASFDALCVAACSAISTASSRPLTDEESLVVIAGCRLTWTGFCSPGVVQRTIDPVTIHFPRAA